MLTTQKMIRTTKSVVMIKSVTRAVSQCHSCPNQWTAKSSVDVDVSNKYSSPNIAIVAKFTVTGYYILIMINSVAIVLTLWEPS